MYNLIIQTHYSNRVYIFSLVLQWVKNQGGLLSMEANSKAKSDLLYKAIEDSRGFYFCPVIKDSRSRITVPFCLSAGAKADNQFLKEAKDLGFLQLQGHRYLYYSVLCISKIIFIIYLFIYRLVGGIRAAMYNALTLEEVKILVDFMIEFQERNPQYSA